MGGFRGQGIKPSGLDLCDLTYLILSDLETIYMTPTSVSLTLYNGDKSRITIKIKLRNTRAVCRNTVNSVTQQIFIEHLLFGAQIIMVGLLTSSRSV